MTHRPLMPYAVAAAWVAYFGVLQWSVVRFEVAIVLVLTAVAVGLAWWQARRPGPFALTGAPAAVALVLGAVVSVTVPVFSYLPDAQEWLARWVLATAAVACAVLLLVVRRAGPWLAAVAGTAYTAAATTAITADPAPRIDVFVLLQQGSMGLLRGENLYTMTWSGSPGVKDIFSYLPWTAVLVSPGRLLLGDVRWMLLLWGLVAAWGMLRLGRWQTGAGIAVALLLLAPGTLTQLDQSWTEPLLLAGLVWWAVLVARGTPASAWWAVLPLALACASKQHLALLLPVLLVWRPFGWLRTLATGALAGVLLLPWFLADPAAFYDDTVGTLLTFHPIRFANTWYLMALNEYGVTLPFWVTGLVVLAALGTTCLVVLRRRPGLPELLRWLALVLLVANLVNKQAFYNQFWLSAALVAASFAASAGDRAAPTGDRPAPAEPQSADDASDVTAGAAAPTPEPARSAS